MSEIEDLRQSILAQVAEYYQKVHEKRPFIPAKTAVGTAFYSYSWEIEAESNSNNHSTKDC